VVLSYRNEDVVLEAVESLLAQSVDLELVVSHSGGGRTEQLLAARPRTSVLAASERRLPGAARNAGVAATRAPIVAFLAADCVAAPGWAQARLRRHRRGAAAVASALVPYGGGTCERAAWLAEHSARLPGVTCPGGGLHGVSYAREALERHGPFPEEMLCGEDTWLNRRLADAGVAIEWAPEVVTLHRYRRRPGAVLVDAWSRGARRMVIRSHPVSRPYAVWSALRATPRAARRGLAAGDCISRRELAQALPLVAACSVSKAAGAALARA